jgi:hypothetical protein
MVSEGFSTAEMAKILDVDDRTIERDRSALRKENAVAKDPALVAEMVGKLMSETEIAVQRIRRVTREREVPPETRIDGEHRCFLILKELVHTLQSLGYLPTAAQRVDAQVTHSLEVPDAEALCAELARLQSIPSAGDLPELRELKKSVDLAALATRVANVSKAADGTEVIN